ncbi:hypothetical protein [Parashewanella tropica]|uniref:hypothetical protein n=1 Tax=Parashewanella tropica TaxID=2547970 RepID=UPI0010599C30|nr:hypothetical protein [Parashewanella tropica]
MDDKKQKDIDEEHFIERDYVIDLEPTVNVANKGLSLTEKKHNLFIVYSIFWALFLNIVFILFININLVTVKFHKATNTKDEQVPKIHSYLYVARKKAKPIEPEKESFSKLIDKKALTTLPEVSSSPSVHQTTVKTKMEKSNKLLESKQAEISIKDIKAMTLSYLSRKKSEGIYSAASEYAKLQTQVGTLSEITPSVKPLWTPEAEKLEDKALIHSVLDPNRIIKKGHICHRVIKIGNKLKPDSEILGYPFKCGESDTDIALKEALQNRMQNIK